MTSKVKRENSTNYSLTKIKMSCLGSDIKFYLLSAQTCVCVSAGCLTLEYNIITLLICVFGPIELINNLKSSKAK